jgi:hypothetical protein
LEENQSKGEKEGRFEEAEKTRKRLKEFKKVEETKLLKELKERQESEKKQVIDEQLAQIDQFARSWEEERSDIEKKFEDLFKLMKDNQNADIETARVEFERLYKKDPNPSADELNNQKILELLIKMKKFDI